VIDSILDGATITNNTIAANNGSGIFWQNTSPRIHNNIVAANTWGLEQVENLSTNPVIGNNCIHGNILKGDASDIKGLVSPIGSNGNISADPQFANPAIGDYHIQPTSPCRNAGDNSKIESEWTDIDGDERLQADIVDMGADESRGSLWRVPTPVVRVHPGGNDLSDGQSWAAAKKTISGGIASVLETGGEVWVAAGTYTETLNLPAYTYLYGGFSGVESDRSERDFTTYDSILDGNETAGVISSTTSGYLVSSVDGFIIQNGKKTTAGGGDFGGGIFCRVTGPMIANNKIQDNTVGVYLSGDLAQGGGVACYLSYAVISGNTFSNNLVLNSFDGSGGGIYSNRSMPYIMENAFIGNQADRGSAIYCYASEPRISGNLIRENQLAITTMPYFGSSKGAVTLALCKTFMIENNTIADNVAAIGAGISTESCFAGRIQNNMIVDNTAYDYSVPAGGLGGGIYCEAQSTIDENIYIVNNTIVGNTASNFMGEQGGGIAISVPPPLPVPDPTPPARLTIANNIVAFNSSGIFQLLTTPMLVPELLNNDIFNDSDDYINLNPGPADISEDPLFADWDGMDDNPDTWEDNDYHLAVGSPCIDSGEDGVAGLPDVDFEGDARILDGDGDGTPRVDMGADEHDRACLGDHDEDGDVDGSDLRAVIAGTLVIDPGDFAIGYGRDNCPM